MNGIIPDIFQVPVVLGTFFLMFFVIYRGLVRPLLAYLGTTLIFIISGLLQPGQLLSGFSNESVASIVLLIIISGGLRKGFDVDFLMSTLLGARNVDIDRPRPRWFLLKMMAQVSLLSSVVNNTPVVALVTPFVYNWGRQRNVAPSKLLIPLSYATIMGGMLTIIGTSTTLILNGFLQELDLSGFPVTPLLVVGSIALVVGIVFLLLVGYRLLPENHDLTDRFIDDRRDYLLETELDPQSTLIGQTIKEAKLRNLKGVYLVEIIRDNRIISPVSPEEIIQQEDVMIFAGDTANIMDLINSNRGIKLPEHPHTTNTFNRLNIIEAVISNNSDLIGKTVKESNFRNRFDAAIVAIRRNGERVRGKIGAIQLSPGDLLLLYAGDDFFTKIKSYQDILVVSELKEVVRPGRRSLIYLGIVVAVALAMLIFGYFSLFSSLLIVFSIMVGIKLISVQDVKKEIDVGMVSLLVMSLAFGQVIINSGTGDFLANSIIQLTDGLGTPVQLLGLIIVTNILTAFISNVGAVSISFPIAYSLSTSMEVDPAPFLLGIAFAASAAFITPVGYQTNLIVYGPGGYSFRDFLRVGLPMTAVYLFTVYLCIIWYYGLV